MMALASKKLFPHPPGAFPVASAPSSVTRQTVARGTGAAVDASPLLPRKSTVTDAIIHTLNENVPKGGAFAQEGAKQANRRELPGQGEPSVGPSSDASPNSPSSQQCGRVTSHRLFVSKRLTTRIEISWRRDATLTTEQALFFRDLVRREILKDCATPTDPKESSPNQATVNTPTVPSLRRTDTGGR